MGRSIKKIIRSSFFFLLAKLVPELNLLKDENIHWPYLKSYLSDSKVNSLAKLMPPYKISNAEIKEGTYLAPNSTVSVAQIGKYCSIGPNFCVVGVFIPPTGYLLHPCFTLLFNKMGKHYHRSIKLKNEKNNYWQRCFYRRQRNGFRRCDSWRRRDHQRRCGCFQGYTALCHRRWMPDQGYKIPLLPRLY